MSYSRWSNSFQYTFWCAPLNKKEENRYNAIFEICDVTSFTAQQLRTDIEECLEKIRCKLEGHDYEEYKELLNELQEYMNEFLQDVDKEYPVEEWEIMQQRQQEDIDYTEFVNKIYEEYNREYNESDDPLKIKRDTIVLRKFVDVCKQYRDNPTSIAAKGLFERVLMYTERWLAE